MHREHGRITFSFGKNWQAFLDTLHPLAIEAAADDFRRWLPDGLHGQSFVDIGSGSGLHSLVAWQLGARPVMSFDVDPKSVAATMRLWERASRPEGWRVQTGSILDVAWLQTLPRFDVAYAWGVLHHTGAMWEALGNAAELVVPGGLLWIALYRRTRISGRSLKLKRVYNALPGPLKPVARYAYACNLFARWLLRGRNPITRVRAHWRGRRGMNFWRDVEDWLGGLPYEVASPEEVLDFLRPRGFILERLSTGHVEGGNNVYVCQRQLKDTHRRATAPGEEYDRVWARTPAP